MSELAVRMRKSVIELSGVPIEQWHGQTERCLARAAHAAGIGFRAARSLFWSQGHVPNGETVARVDAAMARRNQEAKPYEERVADRYEALTARIARLEEALRDAAAHDPG